MTLFSFLDVKYRNLSIELQKDFSLQKEGELKAVYALIQWQRTFFKLIHLPLLVVKYVFTKLGLIQAPQLFVPQKKNETTTQEVDPETSNSHGETSTELH